MSERWKGWWIGYIVGAIVGVIVSRIESFWLVVLIVFPIVTIATLYVAGWNIDLHKNDEKPTL